MPRQGVRALHDHMPNVGGSRPVDRTMGHFGNGPQSRFPISLLEVRYVQPGTGVQLDGTIVVTTTGSRWPARSTPVPRTCRSSAHRR
jgi:hypothetical protein